MTIFSKTAAAALVAGTLGLSIFSPAAFAQDQTKTETPAAKPAPGADAMKPRPEGRRHQDASRERGRGNGGVMGRGILDLVCSPRGAERLEHAFVTISHRVTLTDAQKPAFEALKSAALTAQTDYADTCKASFDAIRADGKTDLLKGMQAKLAVDSARVEALTAMLPKFEDFYTALTPEQKATLEPTRRHQGFNGQNRGPNRFHDQHRQRGMHHQPMQAPAEAGDDVEG